MIQFDEHFFQMGWFNHQPDIGYIYIYMGQTVKHLWQKSWNNFTKLNHTKLLLMDKILHHQGWWGFNHPRWLFGISSINGRWWFQILFLSPWTSEKWSNLTRNSDGLVQPPTSKPTTSTVPKVLNKNCTWKIRLLCLEKTCHHDFCRESSSRFAKV